MAGPWEKYQSGGTIYTPPADPYKKKEDARQDEELVLRQRADARDAAEAERKAKLEREKIAADMVAKGFVPDGNGGWKKDPTTPANDPVTGKIRADAIKGFSSGNALTGSADGLSEKYRKGPGATKGLSGFYDYLPTAENQSFDDMGLQSRGFIKDALGFTGGEGNTIGEVQLNYDPYIPNTSNLDGRIEGKLNAQYRLADQARERAIAQLGGVPDAQGRIWPVGSPEANRILQSVGHGRRFGQEAAQPSVWSQENPARQVISSGSAMRALSGNTRTRTEDSPELAAWVSNAIDQGVPLEQINQRLATDPSGNWGFITPDAYNQARKAGRGNYDLRIQRQVPLSRLEEFSGSNVGAALAGLGNAGSFGAVERLTGDRYNDLRNSDSGWALLGGEVLGSVGASQGIGKLAGAGLSRLSPALANRVLGGGKMAQFGRQVAQDATYGGLTSGISNNDPVGGALAGGLGSAGGQVVGGALGRAVGGLRSPTAQALASDGMVLTPGQIARASLQDTPSTIGLRKMIAGSEDAVANTPLANGMVSAARERGLEQANNRMFRAAADGAPIEGYGVSALNQLDELKGRAYDDALTGVSIPKNDPYLMQRMDAINPGRAPDEFAGFVDNVLKPTFGQGPEISGRQLQDALRMLQTNAKGYRRASVNTPAFADTASALKGVEDALVGATARNAPGAIPKLKTANRLNRNLMVMDDAVGAAANNGEIVTPAQVMQSIRANNSKLGQGRGARALSRSPLYDTVSQMQAVLPNKVPPTGVNAAPALGLLGIAGLGSGQAMDSDTVTALSIPMLLAGAYTKTGGKAFQNALLKRPAAARSLGTAISKHKGLFGSASLPFLLEAQD